MGNRAELAQYGQQQLQQQGQEGLLNQIPPTMMPAQGGYATSPDFRSQLGLLGGGGSITPEGQAGGQASAGSGAPGNPFGTHPDILALQQQLLAQQDAMQHPLARLFEKSRLSFPGGFR